MEPAEDTSLEAAIRWLVDTILGVLLMDKLDAWVRGVKLDDVVAKLKSEVERADSLVHDVRGRADGNRSLARSLARLKELLYDADDVVDELDYVRLQHQVEGVTRDQSEGMHGAERVDDADSPKKSIVGKKRSPVWNHFTTIDAMNSEAKCNYCGTMFKCDTRKNGLGSMKNHIKNICKKKPAAALPPSPSSTGDASGSATASEVATSSHRKRKRANKEPTQSTAAAPYIPWDNAELSEKIKTITSQLRDILATLSKSLGQYGFGCASSSNYHLNTTLDQNLETSSLIPSRVCGRPVEMEFITKLITKKQSHAITVLPIVGTAGLGKTALAQFVYNDPEVESQFQQRIWFCVSRNFDEVRLTRNMLEFLSRERHEGISSFAKLQEILKSRVKSKRLLLVFDDVWDNMKKFRWDKLLAPFIPGQGNGIVVLITTRNLSIAKRLGTLKPVKLGAMEHDMFWLLFRSHALGAGNDKDFSEVSTIGLKIAEKLKGNPLAAVSIGALLRENLTVDHWSEILEKEDWKSLRLGEGTMPALKLSYDQLPYHLQRCFSFCSIFPNKHKFLGKDLVCIWISQGFVKNTCLTMRLEETGWEYLTELVNLGFFQQVEEEEFSPDSQIWYSECSLMHDFARIVSRTECATIDGLQCNKLLPSIHHLSIVTESAYNSKDQHGNIPRNEEFEEILRNAVTSVSKLRTLVLLGQYDTFFLQVLQGILQKAKNLRLLQTSAACADFNSLMCSLADPTHLRYLKHESSEGPQVFVHVLSKLYHLQVLDIGSDIHRDGINNLVSLRHLVVNVGLYSFIPRIGDMTLFQEIHQIMQLGSRNELVQLGLYNHDKVETHDISVTSLQTLHLDGCGGCSLLPSLERLPFLRKLKLRRMQKITEILIASLEELVLTEMPELEICSSTSLEHLSNSLRVLQIQNCHALKKFDLLESNSESESRQRSWLPGLRKLILRNCPQLKVSKPLPPSATVSELLIEKVSTLPYMKGSSCEDLLIAFESSHELRILDDKILAFHSLRNLKSMIIKNCENLFSHLVSLKSLEIRKCAQLFSSDLMPEHILDLEDGSAANGKAFPSLESLTIDSCGISGKWLSLLLKHAPYLEKLDLYEGSSSEMHGVALTGLDQDRLVHFPPNLVSSLKKISIERCPRLTFNLTEEGFSVFTSLQELKVVRCRKLFSSLVHKDENDDRANGRCLLPTSLQELFILGDDDVKTLQPCFPRDLTSLRKLEVFNCLNLESLRLQWCVALEQFVIYDCISLTTVQGPQSLLTKLEVRGCPALESLQLRWCVALEELIIDECESLTTLEGLQFLGSLRHLELSYCPGLPPWLESFSRQGYELWPRLETLETDDPSLLTTSFCERRTSLQRLKLQYLVLTEEQGGALVLIKSLQELEFFHCRDLVDLPAGLYLLPSLKRLKVKICRGISRLPERGLPPSLEELELDSCSKEVADQCRALATSKLVVKIV